MEEERKLQYFYDSTISSIKEQSERDQEKLRKKLEEELEEYKNEISKDIEVQERLHKDEMTREVHRELSSVKLDLRRDESRAEGIIKEKLFEEVKSILREFRKTEEYKELLVHMIKKAQDFAGDEEIVIFICADDAAIKEDVEAAAGVALKISDVPFKGGIHAGIPAKNIFIKNSFHSQVERMKEEYIVRA